MTTAPSGAFDDFDRQCMQRALELAARAATLGEIPVGAVLAQQGAIIAEAHNLRESLHDPTAHAERLALAQAGQNLGSWRLDDSTLYVTLEPCPMCAGATVLARVSRLVFAAEDRKWGGCRSLYRIADDPRANHRVSIASGLFRDASLLLLTDFFRMRRDPDDAPPRRGA